MATPVELAGKPSRIGGAITRGIAWAILVGGLLFAVVLAAIILTLTSTGPLGWILGGAVALATLAVAMPLLYGGRALQKMGTQARREALERAVIGIATQRGGTITAFDLAHALRVPLDEADAFLTDLAKRPDEPVRVDIDDDGRVLYRVVGAGRPKPTSRYRVAEDGRTVEQAEEEELAAEEEAERESRFRDST